MIYRFILCIILMVLGMGLVIGFKPNPCHIVNEWYEVGFMLLGTSSVLTTQFLWKYWR